MSDIKDPIIIDPPGLTPKQVWDECKSYVESVGGMVHEDGEVNLRAAAGADPGCCSCPNCGQYFWNCGRIIECTECQFQFPTDWWPMYSYGVGDKRTLSNPERFPDPNFRNLMIMGIEERMPERIKHPYYRYGFEHPVESAWEQHDKLPWREIMAPSKA